MVEYLHEVRDLVLRAQRGEDAAQSELFRRFAPAAYRVSLSLSRGNRAEAEDLVQEVFVSCLRHLDELREPSHFPGWLLRAVRNRAINRAVQDQNRRRLLDSLIEPPIAEADPFEAYAKEEQLRLVRAVFESLDPGPLKETAQLYYFDGIESAVEIGARLGIPKSTVTTRLDRFRQLLKKRMFAALVSRDEVHAGGGHR